MNLSQTEQDAMRERLKNILIDGVPAAEGWDDETLRLISWLEQTTLPASFDLGDGHRVADGAKYREYLLRAMENAPTSAVARSAAHWLRILHERFGNTAVPQTKTAQTA